MRADFFRLDISWLLTSLAYKVLWLGVIHDVLCRVFRVVRDLVDILMIGCREILNNACGIATETNPLKWDKPVMRDEGRF